MWNYWRSSNEEKYNILAWGGEYFLGYINDYPDYQTQGATLEELIVNLKDINSDIENDLIPGKRTIVELEFA